MVVPPLAGGVPPEAQQLYGDAFTFLAEGVGVGSFRRQNSLDALERVPAAVARLIAGGATAIGVMGRAVPDRRDVDALVISCGGLRTIAATRELEAELHLPVVSSAIAGPWGAVRLLGHSGAAAGGGALTGYPHPFRTLE
jgi:hypothetical protein